MIIYSVSEGLGPSLFTLIHSVMLCSSACASATSFSLSFDAIVILVSSAQMFAFEYFKHLSKSFKYNMNRRGPRQELWGISHVTSLFLDFLPFREQYCCLLCR